MILKNIPNRYSALASEKPELSVCRVVLQEKGLYRIISESGEQSATVSGRFRYETNMPSDYPVVGDYVMADKNGGGQAVIHCLLPRKSLFVRRAAGTAGTEQAVAANIDTVFLCMSLNNDFNVRRLERYISVAWDSGATPVAVLTKSDLCNCIEEKISTIQKVSLGIDIVVTSSVTGNADKALNRYITAGKTVAFVGSSGVGKSTLINGVMGEKHMDTGGLRNDDKGRHTTTHRELIVLPNGASVIDTPGMRELGMWESGTGIATAFSDVEEIAARCRFNDCSHTSEPGCAIRTALEKGDLSKERWSSYKKLMDENSRTGNAEDYIAAKKKKFKSIAKYNKTNKKR